MRIIKKEDLERFNLLKGYIDSEITNLKLQEKILGLKFQNALLELYVKYSLSENDIIDFENGVVSAKLIDPEINWNEEKEKLDKELKNKKEKNEI